RLPRFAAHYRVERAVAGEIAKGDVRLAAQTDTPLANVLAHDLAAELFLEGVDLQQYGVRLAVIPAAQIKNRNAGFLEAQDVHPRLIAVGAPHEVALGLVAAKERDRVKLPRASGRAVVDMPCERRACRVGNERQVERAVAGVHLDEIPIECGETFERGKVV